MERMNDTTDTTMAVSRRRLITRTGTGVVVTGGSLALARRVFATTEPPETASPEASPLAGTPVGSAGNVTIYSGRSEGLVADLIVEFERTTGIDADVRYGNTAELAAQILEEGNNSPADVYFSQDAGALGALAQEGLLAPLSEDVLNRVDTRFRSPDGLWIGASARARVLVYNTDLLTPADLPASVLDLVDPVWKGKVGWAPTNASFQAFVTAMRVLQGEDAARSWLEGMIANETVTFEGNGQIVAAVAAGELPSGLVNHYYLYELQAEEGPQPIANYFFPGGDLGSLVNVAGAAVLSTAANAAQANAFVDFLLSPLAQEYFAQQTAEYPLIEGIATVEGLTPLAEVQSPEIDLTNLADLQGTLTLLTEVGLV
jgi:iron(III) transport system substrate-binding protein